MRHKESLSTLHAPLLWCVNTRVCLALRAHRLIQCLFYRTWSSKTRCIIIHTYTVAVGAFQGVCFSVSVQHILNHLYMFVPHLHYYGAGCALLTRGQVDLQQNQPLSKDTPDMRTPLIIGGTFSFPENRYCTLTGHLTSTNTSSDSLVSGIEGSAAIMLMKILNLKKLTDFPIDL